MTAVTTMVIAAATVIIVVTIVTTGVRMRAESIYSVSGFVPGGRVKLAHLLTRRPLDERRAI